MTIPPRYTSVVAENLLRFAGATNEIMGIALTQEAQLIATAAKKLCPVDTGNLRASIYVAPPDDQKAAGVVVEIGAGGRAGIGNQNGESNTQEVNYAIFVHERLDVKHAPPTQAKFLEQPFVEAVRGMNERVGARIEKLLRARSRTS